MTSRSKPAAAFSPAQAGRLQRLEVAIPPRRLPGILCAPEQAQSIVIFAHGSGSSRFSPRNTAVAAALNAHGMATLLFDLLTPAEETNRANVFDIPLLAARLGDAVRWAAHEAPAGPLPIGLFGASTGAAAALAAAAELPGEIEAVVSRGGRPDLAGEALPQVRAPTLLIVGGADDQVIALNEEALRKLRCVKALKIVPGATHLFPEPGALETVVDLARDWFGRYLAPPSQAQGAKTGHAV